MQAHLLQTIQPAEIGSATSILETLATSIAAGMLLGGFFLGTAAMLLGWSRAGLERRALTDGYLGGLLACGLLVLDLVMRYFV